MSSSAPFDLEAAARQSMIEHGFEPEYPAQVKQELAALQAHLPKTPASVADLRHLLWSSIDNDTSRDLD
ncbi:MAG: RNB domain-containing ribonuclease, partial [Silvibacterium sp.]